jgi:hypothetical protein
LDERFNNLGKKFSKEIVTLEKKSRNLRNEMINKSNQKLNAWGRGGEMNQALYAHINKKRQ